MNLLDQRLPMVRRSGERLTDTLDALLDHFHGDPVVGVVCSDPVASLGTERFLASLLQVAMPPKDQREAAGWHRAPPPRDALREALERHRSAFEFTHPATPFFQVKPDAAEPPEWRPLSYLFPQVPTEEARRNQRTAYASDPVVRQVALSLLPGLFTYDQELFPTAGGGYFGLPHGGDSVKFFIVGPTLWNSLLANCLPEEHPDMAAGPWPAPCDSSVWPWLDPRLACLGTERISANKRAKLAKAGRNDIPETIITSRLGDRHPAAMLMPRRYMIGPVTRGVCDLSGIEGPVVRNYARNTQGIQYDAEGWRHPAVAMRRRWSKDGKQSVEFVKAKGPLRFDDWLEPAYGTEKGLPEPGKPFMCIQPPAAVMQFRQIIGEIEPADDADNGMVSRLFESDEFRLRMAAQYTSGKAVAGLSLREAPLYRLDGDFGVDVSAIAFDLVTLVTGVAEDLEKAVKDVTKGSAKDPANRLPASLKDALLRAAEPHVLSMIAAASSSGTANVGGLLAKVAGEAGKIALKLFDQTFPIQAARAECERIATRRGQLRRDLARRLASLALAADDDGDHPAAEGDDKT